MGQFKDLKSVYQYIFAELWLHKSNRRKVIYPPEWFTSIFVPILVCFSWECKYFFPKEETWKVQKDFTKLMLIIQGKLSRKHKGQTLYTVIKLNITGLYCNNYSHHCWYIYINIYILIIHLNCLQNMLRKSPLPRPQKKTGGGKKKKSQRERKANLYFSFWNLSFFISLSCLFWGKKKKTQQKIPQQKKKPNNPKNQKSKP